MMLAAVLALVMVGPQDSPRQRRTLSNGSVIVVESMPTAKSVSIVLAAKADGVGEKPDSHGRRHLLEHLLLARPGLDAEMEAQGVFFTGRTYRDHIEFEAVCAPDKWNVAVEALRKVVAPLRTSPEAIAKEAALMREEFALRARSVRLADDAFRAGYGEAGLDSFGNLEVMAASTPAQLESLRETHFDARNLRLSIAGKVEVEACLEAGSGWLLEAQSTSPEPLARLGFEAKRTESEAFGEARGARTGPFGTVESLTTLAVGLAIASRSPGCFVVNTPSPLAGMVVVGRQDSLSGLGLDIDALENPRDLFDGGKALLKQFVARSGRNPSSMATWNAQLVVVDPMLTTTVVEERVARIGVEGFVKAFEGFRRENCVVVSGG